MTSNRDKGRIGEEKAVKYLKHRLYKILEINYSKSIGEIDIIAKKGSYIVFVEVKYREDITKGYPREAVTKYKQDKIKKTALYYITENDIKENDYRFDVIEILGNKIEHIKNAFE